MSVVPKISNVYKIGNARVISNSLHYLAFNNAVQANFISTAATGKIITVNSAACKLLGYSKKELLTKSRTDIFDINEKSFKKMLRQRTAEGHSIAMVTAIKKNTKTIPCEITSAIFMDEYGIKKAITTVANISDRILLQKEIDTKKEKEVADNIASAISGQKMIDIKKEKIVADNIVLAKLKQKKIDIQKQKIVNKNIVQALAKSEADIEENNKWIKYIAQSSYDVMWDWNIATGQIYVGDSIKEVFGYSVRNNTLSFTHFCRCLIADEKHVAEKKLYKILEGSSKSWNDTYMIKRHDGSVASTTSRAIIIRDESGKAIRLIGATQDVSRLEQLKKKLEDQIAMQEELGDKFLLAAKLSYDVIWDWDLLTDEVLRGDGFNELLGDIKQNDKGHVADWKKHLHPDDKEAVERSLQDAIASSSNHWEYAFRFIKTDGSLVNVFDRASIIRDADGKAFRMIGAMHDLTLQTTLEEKLGQEIKLKEKQIAEAAADAKEAERSYLGKELHDNINQLLAASRMYLVMAKRGGDNSEMYLTRSAEYTTSAIEEIRKLSKALTTDTIKNLGLCDAIDNIIRDTMETNSIKISFTTKGFIEKAAGDKFKLNIFRMVQEQLHNILKHAQATRVIISLVQNKRSITLTLKDDGVGFDTAKKREGIGVDNIKGRAAVYNGTADFISQPGKGCTLKINFPAATVIREGVQFQY